MLRGGLGRRGPASGISVLKYLKRWTAARPRCGIRSTEGLFTRGGRAVTTFDRNEIAEVISREMRPVQNTDTGKFEQKTRTKLIADLQNALLDLGREEMRPPHLR